MGVHTSGSERHLKWVRKIIECWANPVSANWSLPMRVAHQQVRAGSVRYSWRKKGKEGNKGSYYSEIPVAFVFQTGNIFTHPQGTNTGDVPPGLDDFYLFMQLLNEPKLLESGRENWFIIVHTSPVFPSITLKGWIVPDSVTFPETAESGYGIQWNASLEVHQMTPKLWEIKGLQSKFGEWQR
jgi:hypothetical protein